MKADDTAEPTSHIEQYRISPYGRQFDKRQKQKALLKVD